MRSTRYKYYIVMIGLFGILASCARDDDSAIATPTEIDITLRNALLQSSPTQSIEYFMLPEESDYSSIPQDPLNPITAEKVALGKLLFHETGISINAFKDFSKGTYSCASCHSAQANFMSGLAQGIGEGGIGFGVRGEGRYKGSLYFEDEVDVQPFRAPTIINVAYQENVLWNGMLGATGKNLGTEGKWATDSLAKNNLLGLQGPETQAIAGITFHRMGINEALVNSLGYRELFDAAFPSTPSDARYTKMTAALAIAAYERTILSNRSPFQEWLKGNYRAMSEEQKEGAIVFFGKAQCANCHTGPALNSMEFKAIGFNDLSSSQALNIDDNIIHKGRGGFTGVEEDFYKFKVPQLYNLNRVSHFGHGSSFSTIEQIVEYKNEAVKQNPFIEDSYLDPAFTPLELDRIEIEVLINFLKEGLYDAEIDRYAPSALPSGNCFPNNDPLSKYDLGCDL